MNETTIQITRPPPSVNQMYRNVRGKGRVKSRDYINWQKQSAVEVMLQRPRRHIGRVEIEIRIPESQMRRNADIDNRAKACLDLLVKQGIIVDDSRDFVRKTSVECCTDIEQTEIVIYPIEKAIA